MLFCTLLILFCGVSVRNVAEAVTAAEMRTHLSTTLSSSYYTYVRPVLDQSAVVDVTADLYLIGINSFDNSEQKLTTTAYLEITWTDEIIAANWSDTNVDTIYVPQTDVWIPDLALQNGFKTLSGLGDKFLYLKAEKSGTVTWRPYQVFESACEVDVTFFPFDKTRCELKFVIWSNTKDSATIKTGSVGLNTELYEANSAWNLLTATSADFTTSKSTGVTFTIEIKRKPLHYLINIMVPVILLGVLNAFVFVLPASSGEKTGFSVTAFLSFAVFLTIISTELPRNSTTVSTFSAYLVIMTLTSTVMVVLTIVQLRIFNRADDKPISRYWNGIVSCVRRVQCAICVGSGHVAVEKVNNEVSWQSVTHAVDFVGFWGFMVFMIVFTLTILLVSTIGGNT
ncbi:neuronal acetylcholine receptor subunit alpha-2-like [Mercenaria mercenaria]|uniref:neuronal acetylcholine receptor subunit alpha-2-like n=1 Tax=Mercenaria mercenaria TaxID=6596 RepID=UPI00234E5F43|nr:neuronal acetylcholine receptor subunit alpha-2-like [Mercenaria mercenaria]